MKRCILISVFISVCFSMCSNKHTEYTPYTPEPIVMESRCRLYKNILEAKLQRLERETKPKEKVVPLRFSHDNFNVE